MSHLPSLGPIDYWVIIAYFVISLVIGLYFSKKAVQSITDYFVAGRKMTWWVAGTSIVATSFAADTPLVIAGWMRTDGVQRNWFWWCGIMAFVMCTFFFARLWRRSNLITDIEFNELRYSGKPAAFLRIFHASYQSIIANTLVMGWVTLAMIKILDVTFDIPTLVFDVEHWLPTLVEKGVDVYERVPKDLIAHWPLLGEAVLAPKLTGIFLCFGVTAMYSALSGLWGVMATDFFQFIFAMSGSVVLMVAVLLQVGGPTKMVEEARGAAERGSVVNRAMVPRGVVEKKSFLAGLQDGVIDKIRADRDASATLEGLIGAGLLEYRDEQWTSLRWTVDGWPENRVAAELAKLKLPVDPKLVLGAWEKTYSITKDKFTSEETVSLLLRSGVLVDDGGAEGKKLDYFRIPEPSISEAELHERLDRAGVRDRSEILSAWRNDKAVSAKSITNFTPSFYERKGGGLLAIWSLIFYLGIQWWGGAPGGGYVVQRLFSCKNERHAVGAMLWFNVANFVLRPWPWIIVGTASLFLIPDVTVYGSEYTAEHAYPIMFMKYLGPGLRGMMVAALMAAYMSTIATHVNFGASYVVNDLYKRFLHPRSTEKTTLLMSRVVSILLAVLAGLYCYFSQSISDQWFTYAELMSGTGLAVVIRWYWWRISAWSEIAAMCSSLAMYLLLNYTGIFQGIFELVGLPGYLLDVYEIRFPLNLFCTTVMWVTVTLLMPAEKEGHLIKFYNRVRPAGFWNRIAVKAGNLEHTTIGWVEWACWFLGVTALFAMLFCLGRASFGYFDGLFVAFTLYAVIATVMLFQVMKKIDWTNVIVEEPEGAK